MHAMWLEFHRDLNGIPYRVTPGTWSAVPIEYKGEQQRGQMWTGYSCAL